MLTEVLTNSPQNEPTGGPPSAPAPSPAAPTPAAPSDLAPKPASRGGAPIGNTNAQRGPRRGLRSQSLPADAKHIEREVGGLRAELESKLRMMLPDDGSDIPTWQLALVQSCARHEQLCQLAFKRLRGLDATRPTAEHVQLWAVISKETDARDRCIKALGIDTIDARGFDPAAAIAAARFRALSADDDGEAPQSRATARADDATETPPNVTGGPQHAA